jgi:hypothetical protein
VNLTKYHLPKEKIVEDRQPFLVTDVLEDPAASTFKVQVAKKTICEVLMFSLFSVH